MLKKVSYMNIIYYCFGHNWSLKKIVDIYIFSIIYRTISSLLR